MKSLYRRYRPIKLSDVVGQPQVTEPLIKSLELKRISHAYLFIGPRGTGKTSVARIFAHEVNNFQYEIEDDYVDIIEIDGASNRGIDNIRELREKAAIAPTSGKYKIYIIDEVHMLTKEAFNALLKTLEEPPKHVIFIMATTDAYKVPITITSRAQTYTFKLADSKTMLAYLRKISDVEDIKISDEALEIIAKRGGGSFRDSLSLLDQLSTLSKNEITKELVVKAMGLPEDEKISELLVGYLAGDVVKITTSMKELLSSGVKPETVAEEIIRDILSNPKPELFPLLASLPEVKAPFPEAKLLVALTSKNQSAGQVSSGNMTTSAQMQRLDRPGTSEKSKKLNSDSMNNIEEARKEVSTTKDKIENITVPKKTIANSEESFNWDNFMEKVQSLNDAIYSQLLKTLHEFNNNVLHIYPERKIVRTILSRDNNKRVLAEAAGDIKIEIHEVGEKPKGAAKDEILDRISDIMGGEVQNDGGRNPFEG